MDTRARRLLRQMVLRSNMDESRLIFTAMGASPGVLFEVGAHRGDDTLMAFAQSGWDVHAFEPDATNRAVLEERTADLPNVHVIPEAVSDQPGIMTFYASDESSGISSLAPFTGGHQASGEVKVTTIADYVAKSDVPKVDYLKIDVEGYEKHVLAGYPWETHRPQAILLEFEDAKTEQLGYTWRDLADLLVLQDYVVLVSEWHPIVRYGTVHRWRVLREYPCDLSDTRAWGNLIATTPEIAERVRRATRRAALPARALSAAVVTRDQLSRQRH